jgi:hypothetical protein
MLENNEIKEILQHFPPVELAFAYGSGVFVQKGYDYSSLSTSSSSSSSPLKEKNQKKSSSLPMVDFIFVVENSELWHKENLSRNPAHYSSILSFSAKHIAAFQDRIPSHFWFNAYVPLPVKGGEGRLMKYGIINKSNALKDLFTWNNLYLAGRLHKPVHLLSSSLSSEIEEAIVANHHHAVNTSLLMLPDEFTDLELFLTVASLSYTGDIRMAVGAENPKKVRSLLLLFLFSFISLIFCFLIHSLACSYSVGCFFPFLFCLVCFFDMFPCCQIANLVTPVLSHYQSLYKSILLNTPTMYLKEGKNLSMKPMLDENGSLVNSYVQVSVQFFDRLLFIELLLFLFLHLAGLFG